MTAAARVPLVAHIIHRLDIGGLENGLVNLINVIPAERYRHAIVCLSGFSPEFRSRIRRTDVQVTSVDKRPGKDPRAYLRVWRELRRLRPDIVHTRNIGTIDMQWIACAARVRHRIHGEHGWYANDPHGRDARGRQIRRACRPAVQQFVAMSKDIARWLEHDVRIPAERIRQIYSGVDSGKFRPGVEIPTDLPTSVSRCVEAKHAALPPIILGTVGRLDPIKNQAFILHRVAALRRSDPAAGARLRLVVVGDGPERGALERLAKELEIEEIVWFAGARADTADLYRAFDIYVLPSVNEGISNTLLEAMATALPVIAGNVGGNSELVLSGATGRLFELSDADSFDGALRAYLADEALRNSHGLAGRRRVLAQFSLEAMADQYLSLYDVVSCAE